MPATCGNRSDIVPASSFFCLSSSFSVYLCAALFLGRVISLTIWLTAKPGAEVQGLSGRLAVLRRLLVLAGCPDGLARFLGGLRALDGLAVGRKVLALSLQPLFGLFFLAL
jgi:hypothetical protein